MVKVVERGRFKVYIYETGGRHHLPHCHVRWSDGDTSIALPGLTVIEGDPLPRVARKLLDEYSDELEDVWNVLNPGSPVE
jgi:hypothetical protein